MSVAFELLVLLGGGGGYILLLRGELCLTLTRPFCVSVYVCLGEGGVNRIVWNWNYIYRGLDKRRGCSCTCSYVGRAKMYRVQSSTVGRYTP